MLQGKPLASATASGSAAAGISITSPAKEGFSSSWAGFLPRGMPPSRIGAGLMAADFADRVDAKEALGYAGQLLDICGVEQALAGVDPAVVAEDLSRNAVKTALLARHLVTQGLVSGNSRALEARVQLLEKELSSACEARQHAEKAQAAAEKAKAEADRALSEALQQASDNAAASALTIAQLEEEVAKLEGALKESETQLSDTEEIAAKSWQVGEHMRQFLLDVGVNVLQPRHDQGDTAKTLSWMSMGFEFATKAVHSFGTHCAKIAWTGAFGVMKRLHGLDVPAIKAAVPEMHQEFAENYNSFRQLGGQVADAGKCFREDFWDPSGIRLAKEAALEAAKRSRGRTSSGGQRAPIIEDAPGPGHATPPEDEREDSGATDTQV